MNAEKDPMPWISVAATRYRFRVNVAYYFQKPDHEDAKTQTITDRPGREALIVSDPAFVEREIRRAVGLLARSGAAAKARSTM